MRTSAPLPLRLRRGVLAAATAGLLAGALTACQPPAPTPTPSGSASAPSTTATPSATAEPSPTATAVADDITLPASCDDIYSAEMRAQLEADAPPLNDPGITMPATQNADALRLLESGVPTLRCTWGYPSEMGIATQVSIVEPDAATALMASLVSAGFACDDAQGGTVCRLEERGGEGKSDLAGWGETHFFRGNGWVTTVWLNYDPGAYTEDIASMLWES